MVDTSFYPTAQPQPFNALETFGKYQDIANAQAQNKLLQQELPLLQARTQQEQASAIQANAKIKSLQMLNDPQYLNPDSTLDTNKWISDMAKNPETAPYVPEAITTRSTLNAPIPSGGIDTGGVPLQAATQSVGAKLNPSTGATNQTNVPVITTAPPQGFTTPLPKSRENYNQVNTDANTAPDKLAAFGEVQNLSDQGALTGTNISNAYQTLAKTGIVPQSVTDKAAQTQEIAKYINRIAVGNGLPDSDYRAKELQSSNITPEQLSETIKDLSPFMKASTQGLVAKQAYYNKQTGNGSNLTNEPVASQSWNQNYDPRLLEYDALPTAKAKADFLRQHPDMATPQFKQKYKGLQDMGVVNGQ